MADCMNKELFLDILTKDEREALLTKKMEEIRKKNEALRKRHEEIEADKRVAAKDNPNKDVNSYSRETVHSGSSSPRKESKPLPGEEKRGSRLNKPSGRGRPQGGGKSKEKNPQGPPPDPSYNFLADRRREGTSKEASSNMEYHGDKSPHKEIRRHPKNYGGQDFNNVKAQIRSSKERQERPKSGPPRTKMELAMSMTGKERKQYMEWKAERERVDLERLERQKSNTGEWRRAWDADKNRQDFEKPSSPQRSEPAKRPAGRIGSGRFDRGEREERHRGETPRQKGVKTENEAQTKPVGRGRARGRGRGRGRGDRSPRQRTFSSGDESRKVERQKDLLVVKIDNLGKDTNQSVEVEYWDEDMVDTKSNSAASIKSAASSRDGHSNHVHTRCQEDHQFDDVDDCQDADNGYVSSRHCRHTYSHSLADENEHDESWEDCPEDAEFFAEAEYDGDDKYKEPLKLECKLNPDAPEFTPTSPDFMKTPPGHVKVMDWVTEVNSNLGPPTLDGVNAEECKKALFKGSTCDHTRKKQSSSHGGVEQHNTTNPDPEDLGTSYTEDVELCTTAALEASDEFLDASGDMREHDESQEANQEDKREVETLSVSGKSEEGEEEVVPSPQCEKTGKERQDVDPAQQAEVSTEEKAECPSLQQTYQKREEQIKWEMIGAFAAHHGGDMKSTVNGIQCEPLDKSEDTASDVYASDVPTDTTEQMDTSDLTSASGVSDHTVHSHLVQEKEPTEHNNKSSESEMRIEMTLLPPVTSVAVEDSPVE